MFKLVLEKAEESGIKPQTHALERWSLHTGLPGKSCLCLTFWGITRLFPKKLPHFTFLPEVCESSDTPLPRQHLLLSIFLIITISPVESGISLWFWFVVLEKAEEPEIKLTTFAGSWKKQESSRKTSISALLTMPKPLTVWITINCGKFWDRWDYQTT